MARIGQLDHIALNVRDVERALDFYHGLLGLEVLRLDAFRQGRVPFVSVRVSGETIIDLFPTSSEQGQADQPTPAGRNLNHFCLVTDAEDLQSLQEQLVRAGYAVIDGPGRRWGARGEGLSLYVNDPDGNVVEVRTYAGVTSAGAAPAEPAAGEAV